MKRCAYLTMDSTEGWSIDADLGFPPLVRLGWEVEAIPWRTRGIDWNRYTAVYIGVPWDYPEDPDAFVAVLEAVDRSTAILVNDLALVHWSLPKTYLRDLEQRGAGIVPSVWLDGMDLDAVRNCFDRFGTDRIIVKPVISTNATDTYLLGADDLAAAARQLASVFRGRPLVVQPFVAGIQQEGEFSLFYLGGRFSHAIRKVPAPGDFRVQEEHGADILPVAPEAQLVETGDAVMSLVDPQPVYARADFVRDGDGRFLVMELELIEPSMYLRMDPEAPGRFAAAFDDHVTQRLQGDAA